MNKSKQVTSMVGRDLDKPYAKPEVLEKFEYSTVSEYKPRDRVWRYLRWPVVALFIYIAIDSVFSANVGIAVLSILLAYFCTGWFQPRSS